MKGNIYRKQNARVPECDTMAHDSGPRGEGEWVGSYFSTLREAFGTPACPLRPWGIPAKVQETGPR